MFPLVKSFAGTGAELLSKGQYQAHFVYPAPRGQENKKFYVIVRD